MNCFLRGAGVRLAAGLLLALPACAFGQQIVPANYDESKVGSYTLPDPLLLQNGSRVRDAKTWTQQRRPELIRLFEENVYGRTPCRPADMHWEVFDIDRHALGGKAVRKQVTIYFSKGKNGPKEDVLIYLPANARKPVPVILSLNFSGNQAIITDPGVKLGTIWDVKSRTKHLAVPSYRGRDKEFAGAVEGALARGLGFASIYYGDIEPDFQGGFRYGVRSLYLKPGQTAPAGDEWGAIAAWGWGLSRALDYMETDRAINAKRVAIMGHSRLGKTVLWAAARDTRFAMVLSNASGEGGASLSRRRFGETIKDLNRNFPYWLCGNYAKYGDHADRLPVDAHELIALIAPRYVYLGTGDQDLWSDPKGQFLAAVAAEPVFHLFGKQGLGTNRMPETNKAIVHDIGFHCRSGKHTVLAFDWQQYLNFAAMHLTGK